MTKMFIIAGTDTDVGKTIFAAALVLALDGIYWKPVQSGVEDIDTKTVQNLTGLPPRRFLPERYVFSRPLSPHLAAELDNISMDIDSIKPPDNLDAPLVIEGAGGLLVPYTRKKLQIDHFKKFNIPVILCARTGLGTINHTLLSLEAMRARKIPVQGIVFIGDENNDNMRTIAEFSGEKILGRLPHLERINKEILGAAFEKHFKREDFL